MATPGAARAPRQTAAATRVVDAAQYANGNGGRSGWHAGLQRRRFRRRSKFVLQPDDLPGSARSHMDHHGRILAFCQRRCLELSDVRPFFDELGRRQGLDDSKRPKRRFAATSLYQRSRAHVYGAWLTRFRRIAHWQHGHPSQRQFGQDRVVAYSANRHAMDHVSLARWCDVVRCLHCDARSRPTWPDDARSHRRICESGQRWRILAALVLGGGLIP